MTLELALLSLQGLSVGDAFGEKFFGIDPLPRIQARQLAEGCWSWTDDTHMALSIVETLNKHEHIDPDALMRHFCFRYRQDPGRGYGYGTSQLLQRAPFEDWRTLHHQILPGGSFGNGAAMRAAPIGGYFNGDVLRSAAEARVSAEVTHVHPEGIAGAIAIAVAASLAAGQIIPHGNDFLKAVLSHMPEGLTRAGIQRALEIPTDAPSHQAAAILGSGQNVSAQDTVPFCLWCASHHLDDYEDALWTTVAGLGDRDTTCAIVGGIVALSARQIPVLWLQRREPLPVDFPNINLRSAI